VCGFNNAVVEDIAIEFVMWQLVGTDLDCCGSDMFNIAQG
jgi:hypothetical protein